MPKIKLICGQFTSKQSSRVHVPWPGQSSASKCSPICLGRLDTNSVRSRLSSEKTTDYLLVCSLCELPTAGSLPPQLCGPLPLTSQMVVHDEISLRPYLIGSMVHLAASKRSRHFTLPLW